jgi:hypothetical protein
MRKQTLNSKGFSPIAALIVIVVIVVLGSAEAYVYHRDHKTKATTTAGNTNTKSSTQATKRGSTATPPPPADPYAGWKSYTLASSGVSFKYPANWTLKDQSLAENNIYSVLLSGPNQLSMTIEVAPSGGYGGDDAHILSSEPISTLGGSYYLNYEGLPSDNGMVDRAILSSSPTVQYQFPKLASKSDTIVSVNVEFVNSGQMIAKSLTAFKGGASFQQAKLVIQSMTD